MKKRMLSILLTLCMVLSLLPTTALAGGNDTGMAMATNYAELVSALQDSTVKKLTIYPRLQTGEDEYTYFTWPEGETTLNLDAVNSTCDISLGNGTWTIPENVTVNAYDTVYIGAPTGTEIVIDGTWNCMSNQAIIGNVSGGGAYYGALTVNGTLAVDEGLRVSPAQVASFTLNGTLENAGVCYINNMTMADGAQVVNVPDPEIVNSMREIYLVDGGSITGPGTGSASIGGKITVSKTGMLSGSLTADRITLSSGSTLTVADGADVTIGDLTCNGTSSSPAAINVNGKLTVTTDGYNTVSNATITLGEHGVLALSPNVQFGSSTSNSTIEGAGTLELYGILNEYDECSQAPMVFSVSSDRIDYATGKYVTLTGVSDSVNVVRKWTQCQSHSWGDTTTVAPTCGTAGYTSVICETCQSEKRYDSQPPTGEHTIYFTKSNDSYARVNCSVCGQSDSIYITAKNAVYEEGQAAKTATLNGYGLQWLKEDKIPAIVYANNTAPGTATASATFGDVTISTTFEIVECEHVEGDPATCTKRAVCSKCGLEYGTPLGHTGGTATCKEQAICTRPGCGEKYGDLADHTYVLAHNETMHWVECGVCGLDCLEDYGIESLDQITDEILLEMIGRYLAQHDGGTKDQAIYLEQYNNTPSRHAYSSTDCTEAGTCLLCGYEKSAGSHIWNDGEVTTAPTCTNTGVRTYSCSSCGETKTEEIPTASHTYGEDGTCTVCGASRSEAGTETCSITLHYDDTLCTIRVIDGNTQSSENPTVFVSGNGKSASVPSGSWAIFQITNIRDGYRIGSVTLNGTDRTQSFVNGAYGGLGISSISMDYALTAVMEKIPDTLPSVTSVTLYTDSAGTQPAAENITYTSESTEAWLYGKATFSDGMEYPVYYATGQWQFSTDGTTWKNTKCWGSNRFDFWPGWQYHEELDFLNASYDIRLKVDPKNLYATGASVYSNVIHINGGASGSGTSCDHNWGEWTTTEATCTQDGSRTHICAVCGKTETQTIPATGAHSWDEGTVTTEPTCTQPGVKTYTCSKCQTTRAEEVEATGHAAVTDAAVAATCTETGLTEGSHCSVCDVVLVEQTVIPALGHAWNTTNCAEAATCTREGCGATREAGEHVWGDWTVTKEATCTETGSRSHTCTSCKVEESETIPVTAHTEETIPAVPATCTETGLKEGKKCFVCGKILTAQETAKALGHDWGQWVVDKEATETEDGSRHRTCSRCDAVDTQTLSRLSKQKVGWTIPDTITWTYGQVSGTINTAYNETEDGGALSYSSSDESVATVDTDGVAAIVGAGTTTITVTAAKVDGKYAETPASYTLVINKAPLTVTANNHTITYGQAPANNGWTASRFKYDDTESDVTGTAVYTYSYEQFGNVGTYIINVSGLSARNYDITYAPGTLTVSTAADYTITLGNLVQRDDDITAVTASIAPQDATAEIAVEYFVDGAWTTSLPSAAGEYQVRASLIASSNIQIDGTYTIGKLTIQRTVVEGNIDVSVTVDDGEARISVTEDELSNIVGNAEGEVAIDISGVTGVTDLVLPGDLMDALGESEQVDSLTISTGDASITMSGAVLDTVAEAVTSGEDTVAVRLTAVEENDLTDLQKEALNSITKKAVIVEVSLVITHADESPNTELHQLGGNVEVTVPYTGEVSEGEYIVVCYLSDDGSITYVRATYDAETQQVTFTTNHFSNYALFASANPAVVVNGGSGSGLYAEGATVTIKADSKSGYTFAGWEVVSGGITLADSKAAETTFTMPAANVELEATYTKITSGGGGGGISTYTLTFDTNGGSKIDSVSKAGGATIDLTGYVPIRAGYDFEGWYSDARLTDKVSSVKLTRDMTVYARWTEKSRETPFTDVAADAYYADAVLWAVNEGITSGMTVTTFAPGAPCTRAQAVTFLWRAAGSPAPKADTNPFVDVRDDAYYYEAVLWAVEQGITEGTGDTTFSPNAACTRAQIVTFLWRAQKTPAADGVNPFVDVAADAYYANAALWAAENGITGGTTATTFSPDAVCTRAQIVAFLFRTMKE